MLGASNGRPWRGLPSSRLRLEGSSDPAEGGHGGAGVRTVQEGPIYRPHVARAYARLFRPLHATRHQLSWLDRVTSRCWSHIDVAAYRHLGMSLGVKALGVDDVVLLRTRGRRSGQVREVLVAYVEVGGAPVICAANAGWDCAPSWFNNLRSGGPVEIEYRHGRRAAVAPVVLQGPERDQAFAAIYQAFPHVRLYLSRTARPFPLVRLEPLEASSALPGSAGRGGRSGGLAPGGAPDPQASP
ncbi:MAG: nitroreductase family deazaflavin-dependent oxidoreductase [Actinomycetota bacterium]|nr:nitroreductase family deazaflavin-dependent oxidoreductase [Actinomycetota bacterium]